jgi:hypothetical protein
MFEVWSDQQQNERALRLRLEVFHSRIVLNDWTIVRWRTLVNMRSFLMTRLAGYVSFSIIPRCQPDMLGS